MIGSGPYCSACGSLRCQRCYASIATKKRSVNDRIDGEVARLRGQITSLRAMLTSLEGTVADGHPGVATAHIVADAAIRLVGSTAAIDTMRTIVSHAGLVDDVAKE